MKFLRSILLLLFILVCSVVSGQERKAELISVNLKNVSIDNLVLDIEQKTSYHFYYDRTQFDSLTITIAADQQPVDEVLKQVFKKTNFYAAMDADHHVFLTRGETISTGFPSAKSYESPDSLKRSVALFAEKDKNNSAIKPFAENKVYEIGIRTNTIKEGKATLSGYIYSATTNEPLAGASINMEDGRTAAITDQQGYYSFTLPKGRHVLTIKSPGKKTAKRQLVAYANGTLPIELEDEVKMLKEVIVSSQKDRNVNTPQMGMERLTIKTIKQVPTVFGEADVLRVIQTLPGVKSVGEASTGFNVRGGATDQNLILFNDETIYNPSHFFGFFSAFNSEIIKDVQLYKSSIPSKYGGRLSSVLDITGREGNKKKLSGSAGIGLLTSRINLEGPIKKDRSSYIIGGRTTYSNWLLKLLPENSGYKNSSANFYDVNLLLSQKIDEENDLYFTGYFSNDKFRLNRDTTYGYNNAILSVKWKHAFNKKLDAFFTTGFDRYQYENSSIHNPVNAYKMSFDISQLNLKTDFTYTFESKHILNFGLTSILYKLNPGIFNPLGTASLVVPVHIRREQALESALYIGDWYDITSKLSLNTGVRYSIFNYLGAQKVNLYVPGLPRDESTFLRTDEYGSGQFIKTYHGPEIRLSAKYAFTEDFSVKTGYNTLRQYIHMLSNTTAISPTDIWKLSDPNIKPQTGYQVSLGLFKNFKSDAIETSVEVYFKNLKNYLDYKSGATLVLNQHIETDVINSKGKAYGAEIMIKKKTGKLNGWVSYTYSRTLLKMDDPNIAAVVNRGEYYPANSDKPHDATLVSNFAINHRLSLSLNVLYSTGRPITLPIGRFYYGGSQRALYSDRNAYRIPDYFRSDFSMNIDGNHKVHQRTHNSWTIGVYNLTARKNPYSVYYTSENGMINGYKLSIFGSAITFINFNIKF
ncbi:MAG TPA: TonB-dependent receptor [Chitinophagaceae bacterium]|nr:TonB-dependent receptor [Chitinophagaceae bacterium]